GRKDIALAPFAGGLADLARALLESIERAAGDRHLRAVGREALRHREAEAGAAAGDQDRFAREDLRIEHDESLRRYDERREKIWQNRISIAARSCVGAWVFPRRPLSPPGAPWLRSAPRPMPTSRARCTSRAPRAARCSPRRTNQGSASGFAGPCTVRTAGRPCRRHCSTSGTPTRKGSTTARTRRTGCAGRS